MFQWIVFAAGTIILAGLTYKAIRKREGGYLDFSFLGVIPPVITWLVFVIVWLLIFYVFN